MGTAFPGVVPELYEINACVAAHYRYDHEWQELTVQQKAKLIAVYLANKLLENHAQQATTPHRKPKKT